MLYSILKYPLTLTVRAYFRSVTVRNAQVMNQDKPIILAANHQSAFMDPIVVATVIKPQLYFLARGESFGSPVARWFFKMVNMIPIYRPSETPDLMHKNAEVFNKCFDHLAKGKDLIIFPEGTSKTEPRLRPIKTGASRIALGAEEAHDWKLDVLIVPVGIIYSDPHHFRSHLFIHFGTPIPASKYKQQWKEEGFAAAKAYTAELEQEMKNLVIDIEDESLDELVASINDVYKPELKREVAQSDVAKGEHDFRVQKDIIDAVHHFQETEPERVEEIKSHLHEYQNALQKHGLTDQAFRLKFRAIPKGLLFAFLLLTWPLFIAGWILNFLPYRSAGWITDAIGPRDDFRGSLLIMTGFLSFLVWYIALAVTGFSLLPWYLAFAGLIVAPLLGLFALAYANRYYLLRDRMRIDKLFASKPSEMEHLSTLRKEALASLEKGKEDYLTAVN